MSVNLYAQAKPSHKLVYWEFDKTACPICDKIIIDGNKFSIFKTPEFVLAISGIDNGKWITANVYLLNQSNERIEFDPNESVIAFYKDDFTKPFVEFNSMSPEIAAKKSKGGHSSNFFTLFTAGMATQQVQTNSQTNGTASIIGPGGFANGTYNETTTSTSTVSDPNAKANAQRTVAERQAIAQKKADSVLDWASLHLIA
ncbi:MAG: hypothetical protein M3Q33_04390 [Acidobacteriota bacterium]|nr:hypothetical protein [Acidobacteriota bacterium]